MAAPEILILLILVRFHNTFIARIAQLVEHGSNKPEVTGPSPVTSSWLIGVMVALDTLNVSI